MTGTDQHAVRHRLQPAAWLALGAAGVAAVVTGVVLLVGGGTAATPGPMSAPLPARVGTSVVVRTSPSPQHLAASQLRIPSLDVTASIRTATLADGVLTPPRVPMQVGAWEGSAPLSAPTGEVTLAGHVNWSGMAPFAFARLASLHVGDLVYTTDAAGRQTSWRVSTVTARPKAAGVDRTAFAGRTGPRTLALITCGGSYDSSARSYEANIYVIAHPVG